MSTLCSSRAEYTAHHGGGVRDAVQPLPTRLRLYPSALNAISTEFSMGGAAIITPMGP